MNEFDRIRRQLNHMFTAEESGSGLLGTGVFPQINLTEDTDKYYLKAEIPGVSNENLDIQATAKSIAISGERTITKKDNVRYHRREREAGKFSRMISVPGEIEPERIEAKLEDGILSIHIPKAQASKPRQISVN